VGLLLAFLAGCAFVVLILIADAAHRDRQKRIEERKELARRLAGKR
jgi:hypothetical protein